MFVITCMMIAFVVVATLNNHGFLLGPRWKEPDFLKKPPVWTTSPQGGWTYTKRK